MVERLILNLRIHSVSAPPADALPPAMIIAVEMHAGHMAGSSLGVSSQGRTASRTSDSRANGSDSARILTRAALTAVLHQAIDVRANVCSLLRRVGQRNRAIERDAGFVHAFQLHE